MTTLDLIAWLMFITAGFSYLNHRFLKFPTSIGLMAISLVFSLILIALGELKWIPGLEDSAGALLQSIDFNRLVLHGILGALLFAGSLHVNLEDLAKEKWIITLLASVGVAISTALVGGLMYFILQGLGAGIPLIYCMLFGALISPTDPIAVLAILKTAGAPKSLETKIAGESLFNDGVAVVIFIVILGVASGEHDPTFLSITWLFLKEAVGGALFGLAAGYGAYRLLRTVDNYQVEVLITLALVFAGYAAAEAMHISAPIAAVAAGLLIGNHGRTLAMSEKTTEHVDLFWELVDEVLNGILFVLLGFEILILTFAPVSLTAGLIAIPVVLLARFIGVSLPIWLRKFKREFSPNAIKVLTWGGLRGGISVALALSLPPSPERELILMMTYVVVVFSILVQGLTIGKLVQRGLKS
ncbi:MAG: sodium:proton antiporter [Nitrospinaceae bacterium]|nr:sodium:proton antiporter [Nitrospinaceae bacterium]NIR57162.1 sodium:proton antiporter [Nitrospinaceae bacterium]NIS87604.1 sodium:proton antiporter [Nitrospinaceae bacterium]NIT84475.1 sodium:proton antiporter [Nitrospinaceae bacterium]NIU46661.1 sodium:proton antiporter [Nitrospinaceae bacterium]